MKKDTLTLLTAGIIAGPFFIILSLLQGFTREGFDMVRHPASLLSLGDMGWMQIANFVITGVLYLAAGFGLRRVLKSGIGSKFIFPLFVVWGLSIISGGIFTADPGLGFPPGAPEGPSMEMSWHATIHAFAPIIAFVALTIAFIILARRFGSKGEKNWMWTTYVVSIITIFLSALPSFTGNWETGQFNFVPLWFGVALGYSYTSILIYKLRQEWLKVK